jgi:hypothetical protein
MADLISARTIGQGRLFIDTSLPNQLPAHDDAENMAGISVLIDHATFIGNQPHGRGQRPSGIEN